MQELSSIAPRVKVLRVMHYFSINSDYHTLAPKLRILDLEHYALIPNMARPSKRNPIVP